MQQYLKKEKVQLPEAVIKQKKPTISDNSYQRIMNPNQEVHLIDPKDIKRSSRQLPSDNDLDLSSDSAEELRKQHSRANNDQRQSFIGGQDSLFLQLESEQKLNQSSKQL